MYTSKLVPDANQESKQNIFHKTVRTLQQKLIGIKFSTSKGCKPDENFVLWFTVDVAVVAHIYKILTSNNRYRWHQRLTRMSTISQVYKTYFRGGGGEGSVAKNVDSYAFSTF